MMKTQFRTAFVLGVSSLWVCCAQASDDYPIIEIGKQVYNAYDAKITKVVRITDEQIDEIIRSDPKNPLALFVAATRGDSNLAKRLIEKGANPNEKTFFGHYALHEAVSAGHEEIVALLLAAGAEANVRISPGGPDTPNQWTPLHFAAYGGYAKIAEELIAKGADVSARDLWGMTPLHYAEAQKHDELVIILKSKGAKE